MIDLKYGKIDIPGAPDNEPCIVIRAQDCYALGILRLYHAFVHGGIHARLLRKTIEAFEE